MRRARPIKSTLFSTTVIYTTRISYNMGKESRKRKPTARVSARDIEIYRLVTEEGIKQDAIAERFGICEATVSRTVKRVREYLKDLAGCNWKEKNRDLWLNRMKIPNRMATGVQLIRDRARIFLIRLPILQKCRRASASAGVIVGCAFDSIVDGLTNQELSDEDGLLKTVNGFAAIGGFVFGSVRSVQKLQESKSKQITRRSE